MDKIEICAEIGINHDGDVRRAIDLARLAVKTGANSVKYQIFDTDTLLGGKKVSASPYQQSDHAKNQNDFLEDTQLSYDQFRTVYNTLTYDGIEVFATPYNLSDLEFLSDLGIRRVKLASISAVEHSMVSYAAEKFEHVILSTGFCSVNDLVALSDLLRRTSGPKFTVCHCTSAYPTANASAQLNMLRLLKQYFGEYDLGFSDHTQSPLAGAVAVALGVKFIEKHFTDDVTRRGPDHKASFDFSKMTEFVSYIREAEILVGEVPRPKDQPYDFELPNFQLMRRTPMSRTAIEKGQRLKINDIDWVRPCIDSDAVTYVNSLLNPIAKKNINKGEILNSINIENAG